MTYENSKTIALILLVCISIVLTFSLWTYQPKIETIEESNKIVKEAPMSIKRENTSIIKPSKVIFHKEGRHFVTYQEEEIGLIMKHIRSWEISNLENITSSIPIDEYLSFLHQSGHVEVLYTDNIPFTIYRTILNIDEEKQGLPAFDRFVISMEEETRGQGVIYFLSNDQHLVYKANVSMEKIKAFKSSVFVNATNYAEHFSYDISEVKSVFIPKESISVSKVQYFINTIEQEKFVNSLFTEPDYVKKDKLSYGEVYTDGSRLLQFYDDRKYISFVNLVNTDEQSAGTKDLMQNSIDYINDHVGWTDNYRFFSANEREQTAVYRLFIENLPVFSKNSLTEIRQSWGKNDIIRYQHPIIVMQTAFRPKDFLLPAGEDVITQIRKIPSFDPGLLEDITIGYELTEFQTDSQFVTLEPIWCYKYNGRWLKVDVSETDTMMGGTENGLE